MPNMRLKILFFSTIFILCWCSGYLAAHLTTGQFDPLSLLFYRYILTTVVILLIIVKKFKTSIFDELIKAATKTQIVLGLLYHVIYIGCVFYAVRLGLTAGVVAVIFATQPLLTILITHGLERSLPSKYIFLGAMFCIVGTALLANIHSFQELLFYGLPLLVAISGVLAIAIATIIHAKNASGMEVWSTLFIQFLTATLVLTVVVISKSESLYKDIGSSEVLSVLFLVFFTTLGSYFAMNWLLANISPAIYSMLFYLVPPSVLFLEYLIFGVQVSFIQVIGGLLTLIGIYVSLRPSLVN